MSSRNFMVVVMILAVSLLMLHMKSLVSNNTQSGEISVYQYEQLETAMNLYPEVAEATNELLDHKIVTITEYNRIMRYSSQIKPRRTIKVSALQIPDNEN